MTKSRTLSVLLFSFPFALLMLGCSSDDDDNGGGPDSGIQADSGAPDSGVGPNAFTRVSCADFDAPCRQFLSTEVGMLLDALQSLANGTTVVLGRGKFGLDNAVTIRGAAGVTLTGQGIDETVLSFREQTTQSNGVDVVGDDFTVTDLTIEDARKDGLRVEDSTNVIIRRVKVTWTNGPSPDNGPYGIYPVRCRNVLVEDSQAFNASDAGLYVGQVNRAVVRRNLARGNVAGIEIENTQFADVHENTAEDNTAGLVVFDLPGNPIFGRDVKLHRNVIRNNNRANFAPAGGNAVTTVSQVPAGTGTFVLASRRVEISDNTYENNQTLDIAVLSGRAIQDNPAQWGIRISDLIGNVAGLELSATSTSVQNFQTSEVWIHDNTFSGSGMMPDAGDAAARPIGSLLALTYGGQGGSATPVDNILYDGIDEVVSSSTAGDNTNRNRLCLEDNTGAGYATLDLPALSAKALAFVAGEGPPPDLSDLYRPAAPFAPFDCTGFRNGPIPEIRLPFNIEESEVNFPHVACADVTGACQQFAAGAESDLLDALNNLGHDTTIVLGTGRFGFDNAVTIRNVTGVTLIGQGIDLTTLDFSAQTAQTNGVDVTGDGFTIQDLTIVDAQKDALRIEDSDGVVVRRVKVTWSGGPRTENGAYGIYPVRCTNVVVEDSEAYNASDAGLYVGQVIGAIVRRNVAKRNVAGIEIENTQFADVYANLTEDNTAGLAVFDLPGNPIVGRDVRVHDNAILRNNRDNFAVSGTTVSQIPVGTGTFALASRRVEVFDNLFLANDTSGVSVLSGLVVESSTRAWALDRQVIEGSLDGLELPSTSTTVSNYVLNEIWVHDNHFAEIGTRPDGNLGRPLGSLLALVYVVGGDGPVDSILYDGIGETVDPHVPTNNTNLNHVCVENNTGGTFAVLDFPRISTLPSPTTDDLYRPVAPFLPFNCTGFTAGPIPEIILPLTP